MHQRELGPRPSLTDQIRHSIDSPMNYSLRSLMIVAGIAVAVAAVNILLTVAWMLLTVKGAA